MTSPLPARRRPHRRGAGARCSTAPPRSRPRRSPTSALAGPAHRRVIFDKPTLRTQVSFAAGIAELGGYPLVVDGRLASSACASPSPTPPGSSDRQAAAIVWRTFAPGAARGDGRRHAGVPVVNALTDDFHPCQLLADLHDRPRAQGRPGGLTPRLPRRRRQQHGPLLPARRRHSPACTCGSARPAGYQPDADGRRPGRARSPREHGRLGRSSPTTRQAAVAGADVVATDTWVSMGQEAEKADARRERQPVRRRTPVDRRAAGAAAAPTRSCCTACRPTAARRSPPRSSTARSAWSGTRRRTGCTPRRRCCPGCCEARRDDRRRRSRTRPAAADRRDPRPAPPVQLAGRAARAARRATASRSPRRPCRATSSSSARSRSAPGRRPRVRRARRGRRPHRPRRPQDGHEVSARLRRLCEELLVTAEASANLVVAAHPARRRAVPRLGDRPRRPAGDPRHHRRRRHDHGHHARRRRRRRHRAACFLCPRRQPRLTAPDTDHQTRTTTRTAAHQGETRDRARRPRLLRRPRHLRRHRLDRRRDQAEVVAVAVDVGQGGEDLDVIRQRALDCGAVEADVADARDEFADEYCLPGAAGQRPLHGPLPAGLGAVPAGHRQAPRARRKEHGATSVAHGCTGKGNDQVRFEVGHLQPRPPTCTCIAPVRDLALTRDKAIDYAEKHSLPIETTKKNPYSIDQNILGRAVETGFLEDIWNAPDRGPLLLHQGPGPPARRRRGRHHLRGRRPGGHRRQDGHHAAGHPAAQRARRRRRRRPPRHGRGPAGRHQVPRGLRGARARSR